MLTVQHPLEESRESLAFATEPVFASLANILGQTTNMPQPANMSDYKFYDIEMKYGLLQIGEGLAFLHNDVKLLHKNICPESIVVNQQGAWKIFGFDFCVHNVKPPNATPFYPFEDYSPTVPNVSQPNLDYVAPECILMSSHSTASDMFSLGMLIYSLHSINGPLFPVKDVQQVKQRVQQLKSLAVNKLQCVPEALRECVKLMLNTTAEMRPDAHQFVKIPYFEDVGVKTLTYLDSLLQWDNVQKSQFYRGLPEALSKLPQRVKVQRVLPCLVREFAQPPMIPFVLPSILDIAQECTQKEYTTYILPHLKPIMKLTEPIQILLIFLQRMELLLKLTPPEDVQQHVLPMLYRGLDSDTPQIHELCLSVLPTFAGLLDHASVKNSLLPRIKRLCLSTSGLSVRVNCLLCIGRLLEHLDKWLVLDEVLPFLPQIPSREPAVLMGILGIYKLALNHKKLGISKEIIATRILPFLMPLCIENGLTLAQFNALVALCKQMFQIVETEHRTKLEQLNSVHEQQKVLESGFPTVTSPSKPIDNAFSGLGLDSFVGSMSLEDKQKIAKEQEVVKMMQNQPTIEPLPVKPTSNQVKTQDLTASLLNSNISMFSAASSNSNNNLSNRPAPNYHNVSSPFKPLNQNPWQSNVMQPAASNMWSQNQTTNAAHAKQNEWSALDSLLPTIGSQKSFQSPMIPQRQPLMSGSNANNNTTNPNDDLLDLLS